MITGSSGCRALLCYGNVPLGKALYWLLHFLEPGGKWVPGPDRDARRRSLGRNKVISADCGVLDTDSDLSAYFANFV